MGPNGAGKSTLAKVLAGHPAYQVTEGEILFLGANILEMEPEERAVLGLFMSFQYPPKSPVLRTKHFYFMPTPLCRREKERSHSFNLNLPLF